MNLKGKQSFQATPQIIWDVLMDPEKLADITPGVSKLERIGEDQFNATSEIKIGPVKGNFTGELELMDKNEPHSFTLHVRQLSKIGNANAEVKISIQEVSDSTSELTFDGNAKLSGTLARTGQRVLSGVATKLSNQFFQDLSKVIEATHPPAPIAIKEPGEPAPERKGIFVRLVGWIRSIFSKK